jgi:hypothetical protein
MSPTEIRRKRELFTKLTQKKFREKIFKKKRVIDQIEQFSYLFLTSDDEVTLCEALHSLLDTDLMINSIQQIIKM